MGLKVRFVAHQPILQGLDTSPVPHGHPKNDATTCGKPALVIHSTQDGQKLFIRPFGLGREINQVFLLHANELNADHFEALARMIKKRGYTFISLDEALKDPAYGSADSFTGRGGISWIHRWAISKGKKGAFFKGEPEAPAFIKKLEAARYE